VAGIKAGGTLVGVKLATPVKVAIPEASLILSKEVGTSFGLPNNFSNDRLQVIRKEVTSKVATSKVVINNPATNNPVTSAVDINTSPYLNREFASWFSA
jgi:hypothetical protein